jgi:hypothetical protein
MKKEDSRQEWRRPAESTKRQRVIGEAGQKLYKAGRTGLIARYHFALLARRSGGAKSSNDSLLDSLLFGGSLLTNHDPGAISRYLTI